MIATVARDLLLESPGVAKRPSTLRQYISVEGQGCCIAAVPDCTNIQRSSALGSRAARETVARLGLRLIRSRRHAFLTARR
jgi:hypothetical protein